MPLDPQRARSLREVTEPPLHLDEPEQQYARALAWLGHTVQVRLRFGWTVRGVVAGVAQIPHVKLPGMPSSGVLLLRRGGADVDVLEGYVLGTIVSIVDAVPAPPVPPQWDRRERF
jgi:hypothetical protein